MRETRVKPRSIIAPAVDSVGAIKKYSLWFAVALLAAAVLYSLVMWRTQPSVTAAPGQTRQMVAGACNVPQTTITFGIAPLRLNVEGRCGSHFWYDGHCIAMRRAAWTGDRRTYVDCGAGKLPPDAEYVWSDGSPFVGAYALTARFAHR